MPISKRHYRSHHRNEHALVQMVRLCSTGMKYRDQTDADGGGNGGIQFSCSEYSSESGVQNVRNQNGLIVVLRLLIKNFLGIGMKGFGFILLGTAQSDQGEGVAAYLQDSVVDGSKGRSRISNSKAKVQTGILMANLAASITSGTQTDKAPVYDLDSAHQEIHKIVKDEILPIVNQVDARVQNFKIQFLKEAAKFVRDFKSLAKEADESLTKHKALELEIERLLRAVVSQDIMSIVQSNSVVDTSNLQTELERTKERFENCIIKKENEYAKLWNDWYKKCEECKYDKISYDKAYNDMQQKIERLQAQLGDQKGKSKDTPCVSNTLDPLSQKLENENVELEFQVSEQKDTTKGSRQNAKTRRQTLGAIQRMIGSHLRLRVVATDKEVEVEEQPLGLYCYPNLFMLRRLGLFQAYDRESKASHKFYLEVFGNCPLGK
ncbi:hypothetical protein Tco_0566145 [Tanacetum coccineum]